MQGASRLIHFCIAQSACYNKRVRFNPIWRKLSIAQIAIFMGNRIRKTIHRKEWWFAILDVIGVLTKTTADLIKAPPVETRGLCLTHASSTSGTITHRAPPVETWGLCFFSLFVYIKSDRSRFAWRKMDLNVPYRTSLPWIGTITVSVGLPIFRYLTCEPFWEIKKKPFFSRTLNINLNGMGLGMLKL